MNWNKLHIMAILFCILPGCSNNIGLTYHTQPVGAIISYSDGSQQVGISPARSIFVWDEKHVVDGCLRTKGITAKWVSGAQASSPEVITICSKTGEFTYYLARPSEAPELESDMHFSQEVERTRIMQKQAAIANQQVQLQMIQMFNSMQPKTTTGTIWGSGGRINYQETTK